MRETTAVIISTSIDLQRSIPVGLVVVGDDFTLEPSSSAPCRHHTSC